MPAAEAFDHDDAVLACARGERYALRALYQHEGRWLLGVAQRIVGDRARAEDVLHDAFLQVWQQAGRFDPALGSARGWIYTIVRHRALRDVRHPGRLQAMDPQDVTALSDARQHPGGAHGQAAPEPGEGDGVDRGLDTGSLERCLDRLDEERRACVLHAYVDGYTHEQIAQRLSKPLGTIKSWIRRSLASLKACLA